MNLEEEIGAVRAGMKADLVVIDLSDIAWQPLNSVVRQLVFSGVGRGVETTIVDGEIVMFERRITTIDEASLRDETRLADADVPPRLRQRRRSQPGGDSLLARRQ